MSDVPNPHEPGDPVGDRVGDDSHDWALDRALHEAVGGQLPPDNTFKIVAAVRAAQKQGRRQRRTQPRTQPRTQRRTQRSAPPESRPAPWHRSLWIGILSGAAATLLTMLALKSPSATAPALTIEVTAGAVDWHQSGQPIAAGSGESFTVRPRVGDKVRASEHDNTRLDIEPFGTLALTRGTRLEVLDMEWKEFGIGFGTGTLTIGVLAGAISWLSDGTTTEASSGEKSTIAMQTSKDLRAEAAAAAEKPLRDKLALAQKRIDDLELAAARSPIPEEPTPDAPAEETPEAEEKFDALADYPGYRELFATSDWRGAAESTLGLTKLTREMMDLLAEGQPVPREMLGELRRLAGIMQKHGAQVEATEAVKGLSFETKVRGPIIGANWIHACCKVAKIPLDERQRLQLADLSNRYALEDAQRRAAYGEETPDLARYLDEVEMQDRFYRDTETVLSQAQRALLYAEKFKGRAGASMIGSGSAAWEDWVQSPSYSEKSEFVDALSASWGRSLKLEGGDKATLKTLVEQWIADYPEEYWSRQKDALDRYRYFEVERVRASAKLQIRFYNKLMQSLQLTPEQLEIVRRQKSILVPYRRN